MLNLGKVKWDESGQINLMKTGHSLNQPELLFSRIEDEAIEKQVHKLLKTKEDNQGNTFAANPSKPLISFEEFMKMDIRTGTILEAEKVPKTKKLLKLKIDTGIDKRTVVSGIAEYFIPEEIIGRQVCMLVNLAPRNIKGIESQGMILTAEDHDGNLYFISPSALTRNGSEIK